MRYIATISDRDLLKRCRMCMECIATAKDKQAQEANKYASELLEELDMEKVTLNFCTLYSIMTYHGHMIVLFFDVNCCA